MILDKLILFDDDEDTSQTGNTGTRDGGGNKK